MEKLNSHPQLFSAFSFWESSSSSNLWIIHKTNKGEEKGQTIILCKNILKTLSTDENNNQETYSIKKKNNPETQTDLQLHS